MKNLLFPISLLLALSLVFTSCEDRSDERIFPTSVTLDQTRHALTVGDSLTLRTTVLPANATNQTVMWLSDNDTVALVTDGVVRAIDTGVTIIVVMTEERDNIRDTSTIEVVMGWETPLGRASFATSDTFRISNNDDIVQVWSDVVQVDNCRHKTTFSGWTLAESYRVDCRSNPGRKGTLFSWQAVHDLREELCPYPWRVPTREDFRDLDVAMGGTGNFRTNTAFINANFITRWGGQFRGGCNATGQLFGQDSWAYYWSQSEDGADGGFLLRFSSGGIINPQHWSSKFNGFPLRCVQ